MNRKLVAQWFSNTSPGDVSNVYLGVDLDLQKVMSEAHERAKISSVHVFPLNTINQIMMIKNQRGWDIVGGHVEKEDNGNIVFTATRETLEEAGLEIYDFVPLGVMLVDNTNNAQALKKYPKFSYQVFGVTTKFKDVGIPEGTESVDRCWVNIEDMKSMHHNWIDDYQVFIEKAVNYKNMIS